MFRYLVPRQHGNITSATSTLSQVFKGCNISPPLKLTAGAWNSYRFVKTEKGLPGGTIKEVAGSFSKMANRNEEEYFYNKTKTELEELKKRIRDEPIPPPVKRKLQEEALNLDLQLKRMDLRAVIERAEEDRLGQQLDKKETDPKKKSDEPQIQQKTELESKQTSQKQSLDSKQKGSDIQKSVGNKMQYASDGRVPLQQPQKLFQPQQQADEPILKKRLLERQNSLDINKTDLREIKNKVNIVNKLQKPPKETALQKIMKKEIDLTKLGRNKKGGKGQLRRRGSALQRAIEEAEKAFRDTKEKK